MLSKPSLCVSIVGWGFDPEFYRDLKSYPNLDLFVVSHRDRDEIPDEVVRLVSEEKIFCEPNLGYDWGAHQQFYETGIWKDYAYTVFMHDDVEMRDGAGLFQRCQELLQNHAVVGNVEKGVRPAADHREVFGFSESIPPSADFTFGCVRGSFFMTRRDALEKLGGFEVQWDRLGLDIRFGNWSLVASCARWQERIGGEALTGVGRDWVVPEFPSTQYLYEFRRGGSGVNAKKKKYRPSVRGDDKQAYLKAFRDASEGVVLGRWSGHHCLPFARTVRDCASRSKWKLMRGILTIPGLLVAVRFRLLKAALFS